MGKINRIYDYEVDKICELYEEGYTIQQISQIVKHTEDAIRKALHTRGVEVRKGHEFFYIKVTSDKYEYPVFICETIGELAEHEGKSVTTILSDMCHFNNGRLKTCKYRKIMKLET